MSADTVNKIKTDGRINVNRETTMRLITPAALASALICCTSANAAMVADGRLDPGSEIQLSLFPTDRIGSFYVWSEDGKSPVTFRYSARYGDYTTIVEWDYNFDPPWLWSTFYWTDYDLDQFTDTVTEPTAYRGTVSAGWYNERRYGDEVQGGVTTTTTSLLWQLLQNQGDTPLLYAVRAGVPEPATWAMVIMGFGLAGSALRQKRKGYRVSVNWS